MTTPSRIRVHIICPNCGGKIMEGPRYRSTIELSCLMCWWRDEPFIEQWEESKKKVYERRLKEQRLNERTRKAS
jgi:reverse gyrase